MLLLQLMFLFGLSSLVNCLDNGLALTPPMGWMSWQRFRCLTDCDTYPDDCISEQLFLDMADIMAKDGYLKAGYEYLIIDDCWLADKRDSSGRLQPNASRFPNGIKNLSDYVHSKGLKFGIYEDVGTNTCAGYPGVDNKWEIDANTFAEWGVDYVKLDGCYADTEGMEKKYAEFGAALNKTGRPIVYSCSFPAYKELTANYSAAVEYCNLWRNYGDIDDSWGSVTNIVDWFTKNQGFLNKYAGPGHWNDPDMLIIGNYGLSYDECIAQMTIWSVMAAPLIMSVDLRTIKQEFKEILLNKDAIKINQDELGVPGLMSWTKNNVKIWVKPILPIIDKSLSYALGIVNFQDGGAPYRLELKLSTFGLEHETGYTVKSIFEPGNTYTVTELNDPIEITINPSGAALLQINPIEPTK